MNSLLSAVKDFRMNNRPEQQKKSALFYYYTVPFFDRKHSIFSSAFKTVSKLNMSYFLNCQQDFQLDSHVYFIIYPRENLMLRHFTNDTSYKACVKKMLQPI